MKGDWQCCDRAKPCHHLLGRASPDMLRRGERHHGSFLPLPSRRRVAPGSFPCFELPSIYNFNTGLTGSGDEIWLATNPFKAPWQKTLATLWCHLWSSTRTGGRRYPPRRTKWHASSWGGSSGILHCQWELCTQVYVLEALKTPCVGQQVGRGVPSVLSHASGPGVYTVRIPPLCGCFGWMLPTKGPRDCCKH